MTIRRRCSKTPAVLASSLSANSPAVGLDRAELACEDATHDHYLASKQQTI